MRVSVPLILLLLLATASAQMYYADVVLDVGLDGKVSISGTSNHQLLQNQKTDKYTTKKGPVWTFNMSISDRFSDLVYEVRLPPKASINYVKTSGQFRLQTEDNAIAVKGSGQNTTLSVLVQYSIGEDEKEDMTIYYIAGVSLLLLTVGLVVFFKIRKTPDTQDLLLTDRQKNILDFVRKSREPINQNRVGEALGLPKAAVSRNTETLVKRGFLKKERVGVNMYLVLEKKS